MATALTLSVERGEPRRTTASLAACFRTTIRCATNRFSVFLSANQVLNTAIQVSSQMMQMSL